MQLLATPDHEAHFDFCSNIIQMKVYDSTYRDAFERAISWEPGSDPLKHRDAEFRALLKHEVTHFLDATTTAWGRQFAFRKLRFLDLLLQGNSEVAAAREVFSLESGELELHSSLVRPGNTPPAYCETIQNNLVHSSQFGVCLLLHYLKGSTIEHTVPVSVLSLLEANATASEFLSLLQCANEQPDTVDRRLSIEDIHRRFDNLLNDRGRLEYAALLHVTRVHFSDFELHDLLVLVAGLARFALDLTDMELAMLANPIEDSFRNKALGRALAMELRRGSQRQLVFFKSVLFLYGWLKQLNSSKRETCLEVVRTTPEVAIRRMWSEAFNMQIDDYGQEPLADALAVYSEELLAQYTSLADGRILAESRAHNATQLKSSSAGLLSFCDLRLLDGLFSDGPPIRFPNRIDIETADYVDAHLMVLSKLDSEYRSMSHARFHIPPGTPQIHVL